MRKFLLTLAFIVSLSVCGQNTATQQVEPLSAAAVRHPQTPLFGHLSYDSVLHSMPEYAAAMRQMKNLKAKYDEEAARVEKDFNKKYEEFLEGQRDFPPTILQKRQSELQDLLDKNIAFKEESNRLLKSAEKTILAPLHARLTATLKAVGEERGYAFIINTDNNACPFVNPARGEDITQTVMDRLK